MTTDLASLLDHAVEVTFGFGDHTPSRWCRLCVAADERSMIEPLGGAMPTPASGPLVLAPPGAVDVDRLRAEFERRHRGAVGRPMLLPDVGEARWLDESALPSPRRSACRTTCTSSFGPQ